MQKFPGYQNNLRPNLQVLSVFTIARKTVFGNSAVVILLINFRKTNKGLGFRLPINIIIKVNTRDVDMLFAEANLLRNLNHKNIVKILDCYTFKDLRAYFIMEYLAGVSINCSARWRRGNFPHCQIQIL